MPRNRNNGERRVVVTGLGAVTALGADVDTTWRCLLRGDDGITEVSRFSSEGYRVRRACQVQAATDDGDGSNSLKRDIALRAMKEAVAMARIEPLAHPDRAILMFSTLGSDLLPFEERMRSRQNHGIDAAEAEAMMPSGVARVLAKEFGCEGWVGTVLNACSAGNHALAIARECIKAGRADLAVAGGADVITQTQYTHFDNLRALAPDFCRPFDRNRRGLVIGEGAGFLILESEQHARSRGGPILAEILGAGTSCDAYHMTAPDPSGVGPRKAIEGALADAGLETGQVDYVCAHGTGTPLNDKVEALILRQVFGDGFVASSIKSMIGHCMGAASAIGAVVSVLALRDQVVPPTIHFEEPDPDCAIDCVPNVSREMGLGVVVNNALAFGGNNCAVVIGSYDG